jgi:hypothetical protein
MWWYWWITGQMTEGRLWLSRSLAAADPRPSTLRGGALRAAAALARNSGDLDEARALGEEALGLFRALDDGPGCARCSTTLTITAQGQEDFEASLAFGFELLALAESAGDGRLTAAALNNTAGTLRCLDGWTRRCRSSSAPSGCSGCCRIDAGRRRPCSTSGVVARRRDAFDEASSLHRTAMALYSQLTIEEGLVDTLEGVAYVKAYTGSPGEALTLLAVR